MTKTIFTILIVALAPPARRGVFDFTASDYLVSFAEAQQMAVHGHVLVWHIELPAWVFEPPVTLHRNDALREIEWGGPANAYAVCEAVRPGERLTLRWPAPRFTQVFLPQSVPGRDQSVTVEWLGNTVQHVSPKGQYLPMFGGGSQENG